jgi:uncharacterized protein
MNEILPLDPLHGTSHFGMVLVSLVLGVAFGFFLERAGFGSARNLTSIFILRDFRVFRVMFSAVITGMLGTQLLGALGVMDLGLLEFDPNFFWAMLVGGLVFGVGFYVGGYCPGTAAVALARGRWDGAAFLFGIVLGIYGFALMFDAIGKEPWFVSFYSPAGAERQTLYGDGPSWPWVVALTAIALVAFKVVPLVERRFALRTVEGERPVPPKLTGLLLKAGPPLAGAAAAAVVVLQLVVPAVLPRAEAAPAAVAVDAGDAVEVEPLTLASWAVGEAHRRATDKLPPNAYFVDLRPAASRRSAPFPGAAPLELAAGAERIERLSRALLRLGELVPQGDRAKPIVLIDADGAAATAALARDLRVRGVNAMILAGGYAAWRREVLDASRPLFAPTFAAVAPAPDGAASPGGVDVAEVDARLRRWLAGRSSELPPRLAIPGTILLPAKAATVQARGGGGGGCG